MHERGNGSGHLDSDKHPCRSEDLSSLVLGPDNTGDTQGEVGQVQKRVENDQVRRELEEIALPASPGLLVVTLVDLLNGGTVDVVL